MANKQITALTALTSVASDDELPIYDISAGGEAKKITQDNLIPDASATVKGKVELATNAEALAGTDTVRAVTPDDLLYVLKNMIYPVGSIYTNASVSTNPATLLGFGTWTAFGSGRVMVGLDSGQTEFDTLEETGGAKTHTLAESEIPAHTHTLNNAGNVRSNDNSAVNFAGGTAGYSGTVAITANNTGGGAAHNNLQPYIVVYMWKRTA